MPAPKARKGMETPPTRVTPARQAKRKREEADVDSLVTKLPKKSDEDDVTRDHLTAFHEDLRATGKGDDWSEAHQKLYDYLKEGVHSTRAQIPYM